MAGLSRELVALVQERIVDALLGSGGGAPVVVTDWLAWDLYLAFETAAQGMSEQQVLELLELTFPDPKRSDVVVMAPSSPAMEQAMNDVFIATRAAYADARMMGDPSMAWDAFVQQQGMEQAATANLAAQKSRAMDAWQREAAAGTVPGGTTFFEWLSERAEPTIDDNGNIGLIAASPTLREIVERRLAAAGNFPLVSTPEWRTALNELMRNGQEAIDGAAVLAAELQSSIQAMLEGAGPEAGLGQVTPEEIAQLRSLQAQLADIQGVTPESVAAMIVAGMPTEEALAAQARAEEEALAVQAGAEEEARQLGTRAGRQQAFIQAAAAKGLLSPESSDEDVAAVERLAEQAEREWLLTPDGDYRAIVDRLLTPETLREAATALAGEAEAARFGTEEGRRTEFFTALIQAGKLGLDSPPEVWAGAERAFARWQQSLAFDAAQETPRGAPALLAEAVATVPGQEEATRRAREAVRLSGPPGTQPGAVTPEGMPSPEAAITATAQRALAESRYVVQRRAEIETAQKRLQQLQQEFVATAPADVVEAQRAEGVSLWNRIKQLEGEVAAFTAPLEPIKPGVAQPGAFRAGVQAPELREAATIGGERLEAEIERLTGGREPTPSEAALFAEARGFAAEQAASRAAEAVREEAAEEAAKEAERATAQAAREEEERLAAEREEARRRAAQQRRVAARRVV